MTSIRSTIARGQGGAYAIRSSSATCASTSRCRCLSVSSDSSRCSGLQFVIAQPGPIPRRPSHIMTGQASTPMSTAPMKIAWVTRTTIAL